ncbi:MAG: hypothetical protein C3F12_08500 [Candidatus Methylomirabilota bacterium]|nr:hypothetical protein [candidate division NC10 bacterium]PWB46092.1 MAG: hypothetical protein C3F12_08500 [candidate division NC10 bacterium]
MRCVTRIGLGMALAVLGVAMTALDPPEALATHVVIHTGKLHEAVTSVSAGDHITWINATGDPAIRVVFENGTLGAPVRSKLFTTEASIEFPRVGTYPYHIHVGARPLVLKGTIEVR